MMFISISSFAQVEVDTITGRTAPSNISKDYKTLTHYLCDNVSSDTQKANIIFNWIASNIDFDIEMDKDPEKEEPKPDDVLKNKRTISIGFSKLYVAMCQEAGLNAVVIGGYVRDVFHNDGDPIPTASAVWCGVRINGEWQLVDPLLGAGKITYRPGWLRKVIISITKKDDINYSKKEVFIKEYAPEWFMISPLKMRERRLPTDPYWQLTATHMPMDTFIAGDSAISAYTLNHSSIVRKNALLDRISDLNRAQQLIDKGDRCHTFNAMNYHSLADKESSSANELIEPYRAGLLGYNNSTERTFNNAINNYKLSNTYLDTHKNNLSPYYNDLKKKSTDKNRLAKERIRKVRQELNAESSEFKRRISPAKSKITYYNGEIIKNTQLKNNISTTDIKDVVTIKYPKPKNDPMLKNILASIDTKDSTIKVNNINIDKLLLSINGHFDIVDKTIDKYIIQLKTNDSLFYKEIDTRAYFYDSYDDNINYLIALYDTGWNNVSRLSNTYFNTYDSCIAKFAAVEQLYKDQLRQYQGILRDLKQYKRMSDKLTSLDETYAFVAKQYSDQIDKYNMLLKNNINYYNIYISYSDELSKFFKNAETPIQLFEKIETKRKELEDENIESDKSYYERLIERIKTANEKNIKYLQQFLADHK